MSLRLIIPCLVLATTCGVRPSGAAPDRNLISKALDFPSVDFNVGFEISPAALQPSESGDPQARITRVRAALTGNVSDAERYLEIARAQQKLGLGAEAKQSSSKSAELYRTRLKAEPEQAALVGLGEALQGRGDHAEAEKVLRKAVAAKPKDWSAWSALGNVISGLAWLDLLDPLRERKSTPLPSLGGSGRGQFVELLKELKPNPGQLDRVEAKLKEARDCYHRAATLGSDQPQALADQVGARLLLDLLLEILQQARAGKKPGEDFDALQSRSTARTLLAPEFIRDARRISQLRPEDGKLMGFIVFFEAFASSARKGAAPDFENGRAWKALDDNTRQSATATLSRLEKLTTNPSAEVKATALETLGVLQFLVLGQPQAAEPNLRAAVKADPGSEKAWDALSVLLLEGGRLPELAALTTERNKARDTVKGRLIVAKVFDKLGKTAEALDAARAAAKLEPKAFASNMAVAIALVRKADAESLVEAIDYMDRAGQASDYTADQAPNMIILGATLLALRGDVDGARQNAMKLLQMEPKHEGTRRLLTALGPP